MKKSKKGEALILFVVQATLRGYQSGFHSLPYVVKAKRAPGCDIFSGLLSRPCLYTPIVYSMSLDSMLHTKRHQKGWVAHLKAQCKNDSSSYVASSILAENYVLCLFLRVCFCRSSRSGVRIQPWFTNWGAKQKMPACGSFWVLSYVLVLLACMRWVAPLVEPSTCCLRREWANPHR